MPDDFQKFIKNELDQCEKLLRDSEAYDRIPNDIEIGAEECYKRYGEEGRKQFVKMNHIKTCYEKLAIIYKYYGEEEKAKEMFQFISSIRLPKSRFGHLKEDSQKSWQSLDELSRRQIEKGAQLDLAGKGLEITKHLFEWAAENLIQSDKIIEAAMKYKYYNDIASWYLWRGYALIMLGRYEEAQDNLKEVIPYFTLHKKCGGETWQKVEYYLTKALIPLCEYMLSPGDDNLKMAHKGIEEFIKSFKNNYEKQRAYLYYFHLKERFPEVYGEANTTISKQLPATKKGAAKPVKPLPVIVNTDKKYIVRVITSDELWDEDFGSNSDLERYVGMVKALGDYPVLSNLMDLYVGEEEQKPEPLVEECERLLATPELDEWLRKKTEQILKISEKAKIYDSCIRIEYVDLIWN